MKASILLAVMLSLTACMLPTKKQNPDVAKRPVKTGKFLGKNDYYLEEREEKAGATAVPAEVVKKETIDNSDRLPEPEEYAVSDFPVNKHYKKPAGNFTGFDYNESNDEREEYLAEPEPEKERPLFEEEGLASWYGPGFHGRKTANGERFNQNEMTAAHRRLPMGSLVEVTNLDNGKSVTVRINDRGPYSGKRIIDLSKAAAQELDMLHHGVAEVGIKQVDE